MRCDVRSSSELCVDLNLDGVTGGGFKLFRSFGGGLLDESKVGSSSRYLDVLFHDGEESLEGYSGEQGRSWI